MNKLINAIISIASTSSTSYIKQGVSTLKAFKLLMYSVITALVVITLLLIYALI